MKKSAQGEQQGKETLVDWLKGIGLVGIPLWIVLFSFVASESVNAGTDTAKVDRLLRHIEWKTFIVIFLPRMQELPQNVPLRLFRAKKTR